MSERKTLLVAEVDIAELTLRVAETACGIKRPAGKAAIDALAELEASDPATVASFRRIAHVAAVYVAECIGNGSQPS